MEQPKKDAEATKEEDTSKEDQKTKDEATAIENTDSIDYDKEIKDEKEKGKPDPKIAREAFLEREAKRKEEGEKSSEDDRPLTRKDIEDVESRIEKRNLEIQALTLARQLATSPKEAELIVEKWRNRTFPSSLSLSEQIEESYAITHRKKIIGERNEALRALQGKSGVNDNPAGTHHSESKGREPQLAGNDKAAIQLAGFVFNTTSQRFEKKLPDGSILVMDNKTKKTYLSQKS